MKKRIPIIKFLIFQLIISLLSLQALAIDYNDFPSELQQILDDKIATLNSEGGICIAGRITMSDGKYINGGEDVMINAYVRGDVPLWVYEGGWFIMDHRPGNAEPDKQIKIRAFGYNPTDASVTVLDREMTYLEFEMIKTPAENLSWVIGTVYDENNQPFDNAYVSIKFPFANHGYNSSGYTYPHMEMSTCSDGKYCFEGLSVTEHAVCASASGYAYHYTKFTPPLGDITTEDRKLFPNRRIIIDYVYQADGSYSFIGGDLQRGKIDWLNGEGGVDFSEDEVEGYEPNDLRDLELRQDQDVLKFRNVYCNGRNGFYDAGAVDFESVAEAADAGYSTSEKICSVGHVYVIRTYEDCYAKFIVESDESSFRTVVPGDNDPIDFAGYGLTIDFSFCSDYGKVYVRKYFGTPEGILNSALPYYWEITGMTGLAFSADLTITYNEADVISSGLSEHDLVIIESHDNGETWFQSETQRNVLDNTLRVVEIDSLSLFAIAAAPSSESHTLR